MKQVVPKRPLYHTSEGRSFWGQKGAKKAKIAQDLQPVTLIYLTLQKGKTYVKKTVTKLLSRYTACLKQTGYSLRRSCSLPQRLDEG